MRNGAYALGFLLAAALSTLAQQPPAKTKASLDDDLGTLAGGPYQTTIWELAKKDKQGGTVRLTFYGNGDSANLGVLRPNGTSSGVIFAYELEEKGNQRFIKPSKSELAFAKGDAVIPYQLNGDTLQIEGGKAVLAGAEVDLKGEWRRVKRNFAEEIDKATSLLAGDYLARARIFFEQRVYDKSMKDLDDALRLSPKNELVFEQRARLHGRKKEFGPMAADYARAIELQPKFDLAYNNFAWLLATCPDAKIRNGKKAIEYATKACELTGWSNSSFLDTLAAAYAEAEQFKDAVKWQNKAVEAAESRLIRSDRQKRLELFKANKPFHEEP